MTGLAPSHREDSLTTRIRAEHPDWIVPRWPAPRSVHAFFTTRNAGGERYGTFDVGRNVNVTRTADDAIVANRARARALLPADPMWLEQVHGIGVLDADAVDTEPVSPRADAAVARALDVVLAVRVADCLPVLLCDRAGSVVAVAHAGWRGLAAGVVERTLAAMRSVPAHIIAWLGPAIGPQAFEVGEDVRDAFIRAFADDGAAFSPRAHGKWHADLRALAISRLRRAGVTTIASDASCTSTQPERFHSWRRDRSTGRMAAFIWRARN
jgi:purine-nucleoside/S-methyl-5'-thioadenosine phosphorylase / adenosine deaminase